MRIIGGSARGRRIKSPPGQVRPTSDRVREALFSILGPEVPRGRFLDLFAGSGAVGLEALSRGAQYVEFVEEDPARAAAIRNYLKDFGWSDRGRVLRLSARKYLARVPEKFDIIFVDPPYAGPLLREAIQQIISARALADGGILVLEHPSSTVPDVPGLTTHRVKTYRYGDTTLSVYRPMEVEAEHVKEPGE